MMGGLMTYALTCGGGKPKVKTKNITENGSYSAQDEPVGQGEKKYDGYSIVNVNVVDEYIKEIQDEWFFEEYGHEYDPENPDPDEHYPTPEEVVDKITDAEAIGNWKYTLSVKFIGNYKTYENPGEVLEGNDFSSQLSALSQESGCAINIYGSGYPRWGDNIKSEAIPGKSAYYDEYTAWFIYSIRITAKYRPDENSSWELKYDISGKYGNIWNSIENPEVYANPVTKVDKLWYDAGRVLLIEIT